MPVNAETVPILQDPESRAGVAGALIGAGVGGAAVISYLNGQIKAAHEAMSPVQEDRTNQTRQTLIAHQPASPSPYVEGAVVAGSISLFGMAAVTIACAVRERARKREHDGRKRDAERAKVRHIEDTVSKELDGLNTLEWHANNARGQ